MIHRISPFLILGLLACSGDDKADDTAAERLPAPRLVPQPLSLVQGDGAFTLDLDARIAYSAGAEDEARWLQDRLAPALGGSLELRAGEPEGGDLGLVLVDSGALGDEGYTLAADADGLTITAATTTGLFYGGQTLLQLLPPAALQTTGLLAGALEVPAVAIEDAPRFPQRGLMIDVARHFFTVAEVERQLDWMALHKLNRLHLHLSDDQGWRIEIQSWPDLARIGGATEVGGGAGGYYTQTDYAEIVSYAADLHITVVPEVDFPGHSHAVLSAYPELNASGVAIEPYTGTSVISTSLCLDCEATWRMVEDVLTELAAITPGQEIHFGGDESLDLSSDDYADFLRFAAEVVTAQGKTPTGWDEVGLAGMPTPYNAQYWWHLPETRAAAADGAQILSSPASHAYLDMAYDRYADSGQIWAGLIDTEAAYDWDPVPSGVAESQVSGVEGALWTELVEDEAGLDRMIWPRMAALAEVGWTAEDARDTAGFLDRVAWHGARLEALGVGYYAGVEIDWVSLEDAGD